MCVRCGVLQYVTGCSHVLQRRSLTVVWTRVVCVSCSVLQYLQYVAVSVFDSGMDARSMCKL